MKNFNAFKDCRLSNEKLLKIKGCSYQMPIPPLSDPGDNGDPKLPGTPPVIIPPSGNSNENP